MSGVVVQESVKVFVVSMDFCFKVDECVMELS